MKGGTSGITRGYLRPGFSRSPPLLMAGLLIIAGISAFNYWNLSTQYGDLVKEIAELQDHIRIATHERENCEKRIDTLQQRMRESEDELGHLKITADERTRELAEALKSKQFHSKESESLRSQLRSASENLKNQSSVHDELSLVKFQNSILMEKNSVLQMTLTDTKAQLANLISQNQHPGGWRIPPIRQIGRIRTADDVPGQLSLVAPVHVNVEATDSDQKLNETSLEADRKITGKTAISPNTIRNDFEEAQDIGQPDARDKYNEIDLNLDGQDPSGNSAKVRDIPIGGDQLEEDDGANDANERTTVKGNSPPVGTSLHNRQKSTAVRNKMSTPVDLSAMAKASFTVTPSQKAALVGRATNAPSPRFWVRGDGEKSSGRLVTLSPAALLSSTSVEPKSNVLLGGGVTTDPNGMKGLKKLYFTGGKPFDVKKSEGGKTNVLLAESVSALELKKNVALAPQAFLQTTVSEKSQVSTTTEQSFDIDNHIHNQEMVHFQI